MIWILLFFAIFRPSPLSAQTDPIQLSKFRAIGSTGDWVQIYNNSVSAVNLSDYQFTDSSGNTKTASCILSANSYYQVNFSNQLNNDGDTINIKKNNIIIDSVEYCNHNCPPSSATLDIYSSYCSSRESGLAWTNLNSEIECPQLSNSGCLTPTSVPSPSPNPSTIPTPSPTTIPNSSPSVSISISNSSLKINQSYEININLSNLSVGHSYAYKAFGGKNDNYGISTQKGSTWLNYNSAWSDFPIISATSSTQDNLKLTIRVDDDEPTGSGQLKVKVKDQTDGNDFESPAVNITILQADPTATSTPKITSSPSITQTPTPQPTAVLEPLPTDGLFLEPIQPSGLVAGLSTSADIIISPTPTAKKNLGNDIIPIALVTVGGLFLTAPLIISKIKPA